MLKMWSFQNVRPLQKTLREINRIEFKFQIVNRIKFSKSATGTNTSIVQNSVQLLHSIPVTEILNSVHFWKSSRSFFFSIIKLQSETPPHYWSRMIVQPLINAQRYASVCLFLTRRSLCPFKNVIKRMLYVLICLRASAVALATLWRIDLKTFVVVIFQEL